MITKTDNLQTDINILKNKTCNCEANQTSDYFKYLSSSERKNIVCGVAQEKHLASLTDLGWNCIVTYRQTSRGEKATCRCKAV